MATTFSCGRCGRETPHTEPVTLYCPDCIQVFRGLLALAREKGKTGPHFIDGKFLADRDSPRCVLVNGVECCGLCGARRPALAYGLSPFGCGTYKDCEACGAILEFTEDRGE